MTVEERGAIDATVEICCAFLCHVGTGGAVEIECGNLEIGTKTRVKLQCNFLTICIYNHNMALHSPHVFHQVVYASLNQDGVVHRLESLPFLGSPEIRD